MPEAIEAVAKDLAINKITDNLYDICVKMNEFYASNKVIGSEEQESRIVLLTAAKKVMELSFDILGMKYLDRI